MTLPTLTGIGRIGQQPELSFTPSGVPILKFSVASSRSKKNDDGTWEDTATTWLNVSIWREEAQRLAEILTKGAQIAYSGELHARQYDRSDGTKGLSVDLENAMVRVINQPQRQGGQPSGGGQVTRSSSTPAADPWGGGVATSEPPF